MITLDGDLLACESLTSECRRVLPLHMFCCGPCRITVSRLGTSFLGIFSTQRTVVRLLHVTGINHHHQSIFRRPTPPQQTLPSLLKCTVASQFVLPVYRGFGSLSRRVARSASETGQSFFGVAAAGNKKTLFQGGLVERTPFTFAERATINHPNLGTQADPSHFGARAIDCHPHPLTFPSSFSCFLFHC